ncbi:O-antigen translocase [Aequorivita antarctica]|uniref:O-antigen translocase n=1 Tax=Aequorivita antarctica TaxID=153266 RepID=A0A5C6YY91_9FLAO|nr:O-antigen translocase [Aequorivita antarctica]TXD72688.1 O-antigen translocase [Aequorivita antarctica]SRX74792.1 Lipid III flippase [Aequorivita antarctica]
MLESKNSYRQVMKATSLFGGVQVFNILVSIVRSKFIALWIGPAGYGIASLFTSTLGLISGMTDFGLDKSAVKDISYNYNSENTKSVSRTIQILKRLVWVSACFGALVMMIASPWLSEFAFESKEFTFSFVWLSVALLFKQLSNGQLAILQGLRKLKKLAQANLYGNLFGLVITLPLYYFYRVDAIVPAIIISSFVAFIFTFYYAKTIEIEKIGLSNKEAFSEGKPMIYLGIMLSLSTMIGLLVAYLIQIFISQTGGVTQVGFYNAGFVILNSYVGLVFNAMGTDYFPRLSAISDKIQQIRKTVFEQAFIAILLITPIVVVFLLAAPLIIVILYSKEFTPIISMVNWGILGMVFKAVSFSMGYIIIAKGDSKTFIKTAIGFNALLLVGNVVGYYYGGLEGLGISFLLYYIIHFAGIRIITKYRYGFYFEKGFYSVFAICILLCGVSFLLTYLENTYLKYIALSLVALFSFVFSYIQLDKKMDIKEVFGKFFRRKK